MYIYIYFDHGIWLHGFYAQSQILDLLFNWVVQEANRDIILPQLVYSLGQLEKEAGQYYLLILTCLTSREIKNSAFKCGWNRFVYPFSDI